MKKLYVIVVILAMMIPLISGCTISNRMADVTVVSTKNISSLKGAQKMGEFEGKDCIPIFKVWFGGIPNLEEAIDEALAKGEGNALLDCVYYDEKTMCLCTPLQVCYRVKGTVIKTKDVFTETSLMQEIDLKRKVGDISEVKTTHYNGNTYVWIKSDKSTQDINVFEAVYRIPAKTIAKND